MPKRQIKNEAIRHKMLEVMGGDARLGVYMYHFNSLKQCEQILDWLLANKFKGHILYEWIKMCHGGSILRTAQFIIKRVEKNPEEKPIIYGKDYFG